MRKSNQDGGWNAIIVLEQPQGHFLPHSGNSQGEGEFKVQYV